MKKNQENYFIFIKDEFNKFKCNKKFPEEKYNKFDICFFLFFYIFALVIWVAIRTIIFPNWINDIGENNILNNGNISTVRILYLFEIIVIKILCPTIACSWIFKKNSKIFMKNKLWILIFFYPMRLLIFEFFYILPIDPYTLKFITNVIIPIIFIIFYFWNNKEFLEQINFIFKIKKFLYFIFFFIIFGIILILLTLLFNLITISIGGGIPSNESSLKEYLKSPHEIAILFFSAVIIAPLIEEFVFRKSIADICDNKLWAWPITTFYFAFVHISNYGDWENLMIYIPLGLISGFLYYKLNNISFPIALHFSNNLIAFISYFI